MLQTDDSLGLSTDKGDGKSEHAEGPSDHYSYSYSYYYYYYYYHHSYMEYISQILPLRSSSKVGDTVPS